MEFDVDDKGVSNIKIVQGINEEMNNSVIKTIEKTSKKWKPLEINQQSTKSILRFHFIFYIGVVELGIKFSN